MGNLEMLELAAKAAGIAHVNYERIGYDGGDGLVIVGEHGQHLHVWNPLTDDGDALRLAVSLRIETEFFGQTVYAGPRKTAKYAVDTEFDRDMFSSARLAIVLAAANIGEAMP